MHAKILPVIFSPVSGLILAAVYAVGVIRGESMSDTLMAVSVASFGIGIVIFFGTAFAPQSIVPKSDAYARAVDTCIGIAALTQVAMFFAATILNASSVETIIAGVPAVFVTGVCVYDSFGDWFWRSVLVPAALLLAFYLDYFHMRLLAAAAFGFVLFVQFIWTTWDWPWSKWTKSQEPSF